MNQLAKRLTLWSAAIALLLMIPLIAMQMTSEVQWTVADFLIMGTALAAMIMAYELIARRSGAWVYRLAIGVGLAGAFLLFWVNAAVGIIGSEDQPPNMLYGAVFVVCLAGAFVSRFKPGGMALTLYAAAATQLLVPVIAFFAWPPPETSWSPGVIQVFLLSAFFATLFVVSGVLFGRANKDQIS
jgi:hypothetical protein